MELAPSGFEESEADGVVELAAYGAAAERVIAEFPDAEVAEVAEGWEDRWRDFHHGVTIGRLWVGPPWETPPDGSLAVTIDPGRAFGTGSHPSTRLCLELLLEEQPASMLDLGCGSGVIAIAAARLGFAPLSAVDIDEVAVETARENARLNGVTLEATQADARFDRLPEAELTVANVSLEAVRAIAGRVASPRVVTAGYLAGDRPELHRFRHAARRELDGWAADLFIR